MIENDPRFMLEYHGHGKLLVGGEVYGTGSFHLTRPQYQPATGFICTVLIDRIGMVADLDYRGGFSFDGVESFGRRVEIPRLQQVSLRGSNPIRCRAAAPEVLVGVEEFQTNPEQLILRALLTRSDAVSPLYQSETFTNDGRITSDQPIHPQNINSVLGTLVVQESYVFERIEGEGAEGDMRIRRLVAEVSPVVSLHTHNLPEIFRSLNNELDDICTVLGFLGRQKSEWFEMVSTMSPAPREGFAFSDRADWFKATIPPRTRRISTPIWDSSTVPPDALDRMVLAYRQSPIRDGIRLAIEYLIASVEEGALESRLVGTFTALEAIIDAIGKADDTAHTMPEKQFKSLASRIRKVIRPFFEERELNADLLPETLDKVQELQRRPIAPRTLAALKKHDIFTADIWPDGTALESGLAAAYKIRNSLVHAGLITDRNKAERMRLRVHVLAERLIYRLLGGEDEWIHPYAYDHTSRLQRMM
ncbi:MAG TPA: hypothetical protein VEQ60_29545 [Longimicrobium sp.]|nr:hypothetical protein [Longimicrobium sp.]